MAKRIITAFAEAGDRATMPDTPVGTNSNYQTGYPAEYEEDPVANPTTAKFVERNKSNQLYNDITANIKEWQEQTFPAFITSANNGGVPFSYSKGTIVKSAGDTYISDEDANEDVPPSAKWSKIPDGFIPVSGGGQFKVNKSYLITDSSTYTLPVTTTLSVKDYVKVSRLASALLADPTPLIQVDGTNAENINYIDQSTGVIDSVDTSVSYNITSELTFIFNIDWEL